MGELMAAEKESSKKVHFIGICGVAMSAVAIALYRKGWQITGSDAGFFPPVSTNLTKLGIAYYSGWHPEKLIENGKPDLVIVGNAVGSQNPELLYVRENKIPYVALADAVGKYLVKEESIVVVGTYGKTTSSALLAHIFKEAGRDPSYMTGGVLISGEPSAADGGGAWSIAEGDEYSTAKWDKTAKFFHYKPKHLLMTAVKWDHADLYPTENEYFDAFRKLIAMIPEDGIIVACMDTKTLPKLLKDAGRRFKSYGKDKKADHRYENVEQSADGLSFDIVNGKGKYTVKSQLLGAYNAENITGCFAMACEANIEPEEVLKAIASFKGLKRRLEKRLDGSTTPAGASVIDDIAHSPEKARSVLNNLRHIYPGLVIAVFEPNTGNRTRQSKSAYKDAFRDADTVVVPKLSRLKVDASDPERTFEGDELAETIRESHKEVYYIDDDDKLVDYLTTARGKGDIIAFLGSHGFRWMIEETVKRLGGQE